MDENKEFHKTPRMSASGFARLAACPASFAAESEMSDFRETYGIADEPDDESSASGTDMHAVLAKVPYSCERFGCGDDFRSPLAKITEAIKVLGMEESTVFKERENVWLASRLLARRDGFITGWLEDAVTKYGGFEDFKLSLDDARLPLPGTEFTGLPDVLGVLSAPDGKHVLIADYKTGWKGADYPHPSVNGQILGLSVLADANLEGVVSVTGTLLHRGNASSRQPIEAARFERSDLDAARLYADTVLNTSAAIAAFAKSQYSGGKAIPKRYADQIAAHQSVGDHCGYSVVGVMVLGYLALSERIVIFSTQISTPSRITGAGRVRRKETSTRLPSAFSSVFSTFGMGFIMTMRMGFSSSAGCLSSPVVSTRSGRSGRRTKGNTVPLGP